LKLTGHEIGDSDDAYDEDDDPFLGFLDEVSHYHLVRLRRHVHRKRNSPNRLAIGKVKTRFKSISTSSQDRKGNSVEDADEELDIERERS